MGSYSESGVCLSASGSKYIEVLGYLKETKNANNFIASSLLAFQLEILIGAIGSGLEQLKENTASFEPHYAISIT